MNTFSQFTPEQRVEALAKAHEARAQKAIDRANNVHGIKRSYLDAPHWAYLASGFGIRMPNIADKTTTGLIAKYLKKLSIPRDVFDAHYTSATYFIKNNPKWSAYVIVGLLCELKQDISK